MDWTAAGIVLAADIRCCPPCCDNMPAPLLLILPLKAREPETTDPVDGKRHK